MSVRFQPDNLEVQPEEGETLLRVAWRGDVPIRQTCGSQGTCGRCRVRLVEGELRALRDGAIWTDEDGTWALACQTVPVGAVVVEVPSRSRQSGPGEGGVLLESEEEDLTVTDPLLERREVELPPPTLDDPTDDWLRLGLALSREGVSDPLTASPAVLAKLPGTLREGGFRTTVELGWSKGRVVVGDVFVPGSEPIPFGVAIDLGTTTVAVALVDMRTGYTLARAGDVNGQYQYAEDVIARIVFTEETPDGSGILRKAALETINRLIQAVTLKNGLEPRDVRAAVVSGNTTMVHLLLGVSAAHLRREPYIPAFTRLPDLSASEVGLRIHPSARVHFLPAVASYLGGDVVGGVLASRMHETEGISLLLDFGTNGEMVLGGREWLIGCATSAGPAFEGSGIKHGMRAVPGAIESVRIHPGAERIEVRTVGNAAAAGICGSGLIDVLGEMVRTGVVDRSGQFSPELGSGRLKPAPEGGLEFTLVPAEESARGEEITLAQADIENLIRAKGAIFAGMRALLEYMGLTTGDIDHVLIAGGFGRSLELEKAIAIGLLPDIPRERFRYIGNSSLQGAKRVLLSRAAREEIDNLAAAITYLDLSLVPSYMDEFVSALFLPHTDLGLFPSLEREEALGGEAV